MDGKAVFWLPAPWRTARDTKMAFFVLHAAFGDSHGHKNGVFCVASRPLAAKILSNSTLQNSD